jgi:hypothetical protein
MSATGATGKRRGRKPGSGEFPHRIDVRISDELYERLRARAMVSDESIGQYVRDVLLAAALIGEDPLGALHGILSDPNAERTEFVQLPAKRSATKRAPA